VNLIKKITNNSEIIIGLTIILAIVIYCINNCGVNYYAG